MTANAHRGAPLAHSLAMLLRSAALDSARAACAVLNLLVCASALALAPGCENPEEEETSAAQLVPDAPPGVVDEVRDEPSDAHITQAVERTLFLAGAVDDSRVDTRTTLGVVELTGTVPHPLAKRRATVQAAAVKGVRSISNRLEVDAI